MSKSLIFSLMANVYCRLLSSDMHAKITKSRKCETPLMEPATAKASPFPIDPGFRERVTCTQKVRVAYGLRPSDNPQISA